MSFDPYIHFMGNCEAAMRFYAMLFGAAPPVLMRYGEDETVSRGMSEAGKRQIMHAALTVGGRVLMASDWPETHQGVPQASVTISHTERTRAAAEAIYAQLADGAQEVMMPFGDTFWADGFGMLRDRFGTAWMIAGPALDFARKA